MQSKYLRKFDNTIDETTVKEQEAKQTDTTDLMEDTEDNITKSTEESIDDIDPIINDDPEKS